jgi:hypothetical protein
MKVTWMAGILAAATGLALPARSEAGARIGIGIMVGDRGYDRYGYGDRGAYVNTFDVGYNRGYHDGLNRGRHDGEHNDRFDFWRERCYRNGDAGYRREFGPKYEYVNGYRRGYEEGYRRAYRQTRFDYRGDYHRGYGDDRYRDDGYRDRYRDDRYRDGYHDRDWQ